jgi:hypothetical protein
VASLIVEAKERGAAIVGVFHDREVRDLVADKTLELGSDAAAESPPADGGETSEKGSVALSAEDGESPQDAPKLSGGGRRA